MDSLKELPPVQEPTNIDGVAIHLSYIRRDIKSMSDKLDTIANSYVGMPEHIHFKEYVETNYTLKLETKEIKDEVLEHKASIKELVEFKDTLTGKMIAMASISGILVGAITLIIQH